MNDIYELNLAQSKYEQAFNEGNPELLASVVSAGFLDLNQHRPTRFGPEGKEALCKYLRELSSEYEIRLAITTFFHQVMGQTAFSAGMEMWDLKPKSGGPSLAQQNRYLEIWNREDGAWRLGAFMDNPDLPPSLL